MIAAAGDIACGPSDLNFNGGLGTADACRQLYTSDLLVSSPYAAVLPLGDLQYQNATLAEFQQAYSPSWGRVDPIAHPVPGNHEYLTPNAAGYFSYFGTTAGDPSKGYYSYDIGTWHLIALNSETDLGAGGAQDQWLKADLAAHSNTCTLAYWHRPRFSSLQNDPSYDFLWQTLYAGGADVVLNGHEHAYERFAPQNPTGVADPANGIREFIVGTGGEGHSPPFGAPPANGQARDNATYGILQLTLHASGYDWRFIPASGGFFTDSGSGTCH